MNVKVNFNKSAVKARVEGARNKGLTIVANEALKDANYFCRRDSGMLIDSSILASNPGKQELIWGGKGEGLPYAKKMYYTGTPVTDENPNASLMWAHKAFSVFREKYKRILQKILNQEV